MEKADVTCLQNAFITRRSFVLLAVAAFGACASSCAQPLEQGDTSDKSGSVVADSAAARLGESWPISFRFADAEEGRDLLLAADDYLAGFTQEDLNFRLQKKNATLDEWKELASGQVLDFAPEEKQAISQGMEELAALAERRNLVLPSCDELVFVKTTMAEEPDADAYTHGTQIFLGDYLCADLASDNADEREMALVTLAHEVFHCLSRANPGFRAQMYGILGFDVQDEDFVFGPAVRERILSNSDVEHHDSSAVFTIEGQKRRCAVVFYEKSPFEEKGDSFYTLGGTGLVPIDDLDMLYDSEEASDFRDVFGRNTSYVIDPEECMADNFSYALIYGPDGLEYETPEIIEGILDCLKK